MHAPRAQALERGLDHRRDPREAETALEEGMDGYLVGGVQHAGRRAARRGRVPGQAKAREGLGVHRLERQRAQCGQVELGHRHVDAVRIVQGVGDRHPHVGIAQVGQG